MIDVRRGSVVKVSAGKEKGDFFVILELKKNYVIISDGKCRPIEKAKRKNYKHIFLTSLVLSEDLLETNRKIRKALSEFAD